MNCTTVRLIVLVQRLVFLISVAKLDNEGGVVGHQPITLGTYIAQWGKKKPQMLLGKKKLQCVFYEATKYPQMKVICIPSIRGIGGAGPSSLHTVLEGPTEYVNARWM